MSPTARALAQLRKDGWLAEVVERFIPGARVRKDLFGFIDIAAIHPPIAPHTVFHVGIFGVQVTTKAHMADRLAKIAAPPCVEKARIYLNNGNTLEIWGYAKQGPRGGRKTWTLTRRVVTLGDLA